MRKSLQINSVVSSGSTGRIVEEIGQTALANGWESYIAYGRNLSTSKSILIKIGTELDNKLHGLQTRIFDRHGFGSYKATINLINQIDQIKPSIIHLHNLHGYYLNVEALFKYLNRTTIPVLWTLHDCWSLTGHCAHFDFIGCEKWLSGCHNCPQKKEYPASYFLDRSLKNYSLKKELFTSAKNMTIIPVSEWLGSIVKRSYLSKYPTQVINNGIDLQIFHPEKESINVKGKYNIENKFIVLGVATAWSNEKGLKEFIELSKYSEWKVVLIGVKNSIKKKLPKNILALSRTENQHELAAFYSAADVLVNPTYQDSFPTVNLESLACGTPIITYKTGGSIEAVTPETGFIVEKGDINGLISAINSIKQNVKGYYRIACRKRAENFYNKDDRYMDYITLYESILNKSIDN